MTEIYNYDVPIHERFARDQQEVEAFRKQYHIPPSGTRLIAVQTQILDLVPKPSAVVLLMQTYQRKLWALFEFPKDYYAQRFTSPYVAPSLGSPEKQDADIKRIDAFVEKEKQKRERGEEEEELDQESDALRKLLAQGVKETNVMVEYVIARMHQFVQG